MSNNTIAWASSSDQLSTLTSFQNKSCCRTHVTLNLGLCQEELNYMSESLQPSTVDSKCFLISTCFLFLQLLLSASVDTSHKSAQAQHHKASNLKTKLYFYPVIVSKHHRCLLPQPPPPLPPLSILSLLYCFPQLFSRFYGAVDPRKWYCLPLKWMFSMFWAIILTVFMKESAPHVL